MKYCTQCGHANDDDALFCEKDGWKLSDSIKDEPNGKKVCEKCGTLNSKNLSTCENCGARLGKKGNDNVAIKKYAYSVVFVLVVAILGYLVWTNSDVYEKYVCDEELSAEEFDEKYYLNVESLHSASVNKDGGYVIFRIDTNYKCYKRKMNISFDERNTGFDTPSKTYYGRMYAPSHLRTNCLVPVWYLEFLDGNTLKITFDKNDGYNRTIALDFEIRVSEDKILHEDVDVFQEGYYK